GLTWLLPEWFSESEIGPEAVTTFLGIITAINEHIIETTPSQKGSDLEILVEVVAQHYYGDKKKWNFIAITEATNLTLEAVQSGKPGRNQRHDYLQNNYGHNSWNLEGRALSALNRFGENARTASEPVWLQRIQHQQAIMEPPAPMVERPTLSKLLSAKGTIGALFVMGEVLFITRPLIYVLFIRKYGIRSWIPWFLSLAVDFTGLGFLSLATRSRHVGKEQT
ncbi:hypothetical protein CISIN_1g0410783mg, partial [Citrus sinensis]